MPQCITAALERDIDSQNASDHPRRLQQVCDNCRFRKTKCDRKVPCSGCVAASVRCEYRHTLRRKGPRAGKGRRLHQIRQGLTEIDGDYIEVTTPKQVQWELAQDRKYKSEAQGILSVTLETPTSEPSASGDEFCTSQLSMAVAANVQVFLEHLLPIMPVVRGSELLADTLQFHQQSLPRQALILSLCAATRIQLKLDNTEGSEHTKTDPNASLGLPLTGTGLLSAAKLKIRQFDIVDNLSLDSILTSFFLFAAYGNLEQHHHAAFYLSESLTMALSLGLDNEAMYADIPASDRDLRRRIFWLLFVTERYTAHVSFLGLMLRIHISKTERTRYNAVGL